MMEITGIPSKEEILKVFPSIERINKGPVAIIECYQKIPCNPCSTICKQDAIENFKDINDRPVLNVEKCNGCGLCISICPGLAIMVVDGSYSNKEVLFKIPYEFLPLPNKGDIVNGLNRAGEYIGDVKIVKVQSLKAYDKTPIIYVAVNRDYLYEFRNISLKECYHER